MEVIDLSKFMEETKKTQLRIFGDAVRIPKIC